MDLTMLGTGHAVVTQCYNTCFVLHEGDKRFLVDGGGGMGLLRQLRAAGFDWADMTEIFVTHKHLDHLLGILWLLRLFGHSFAAGKCPREVHIYGHDEVIALLRELAELLLSPRETACLGHGVELIPVSAGERRTILDREVTFFDLRARKDKQFGFSMDLPGGALMCCGDESYKPWEEPYVRGCQWLLHEAFCLHSEADIFRPYEKAHSTVMDACKTAQDLGVRNLVLYHTEDTHLPHRKALYQAEGAQYFTGNLFVPDDLETIRLC